MKHAVSNRAQKPLQQGEILVPLGNDIKLEAFLAVPNPCRGIVIFVHDRLSDRQCPLNAATAKILNNNNIATLRINLLDNKEKAADHSNQLSFDMPFLAKRLSAISDWLATQPQLSNLKQGYFAVGTGTAAALMAVADYPAHVSAVATRSGRPDLASAALRHINLPVLFLVGSLDEDIAALNRKARKVMNNPAVLRVIEGANGSFAYPKPLMHAADAAALWFTHYFSIDTGFQA